jgi:hypothetical protein
LGEADTFRTWFRKKGALCDTSFALVNKHKGSFQVHFDRCSDDSTHTRLNCRVVCVIFASFYNLSREQWLTLLLGQDLVPLDHHDKNIVRAELDAIAKDGKMTRKHCVRSRDAHGLAATADDNSFAR